LHEHEPMMANAVLEGHVRLPPSETRQVSVGVFGGRTVTLLLSREVALQVLTLRPNSTF